MYKAGNLTCVSPNVLTSHSKTRPVLAVPYIAQFMYVLKP
jgi:hypothetical protein